jgi:hypothetical protein
LNRLRLRLAAVAARTSAGIDTRQSLTGHGIEGRRAIRSKLEGIAVAACDQDCAAAPFLGGRSGGKKVVGFEARRFGILEAASSDEFWIRSSCSSKASSNSRPLWYACRCQRVPGYQQRMRLFLAVTTQQKIGKAEDGPGGLAASPQDRFRQGVVGAMGE